MPDELAGVAEIAKMFKTTRRTVERWAQRDDFPAPVSPPVQYAKFIRGRVWRRNAIERWGREHLLPKTGQLPKTGRPRKSS